MKLTFFKAKSSSKDGCMAPITRCLFLTGVQAPVAPTLTRALRTDIKSAFGRSNLSPNMKFIKVFITNFTLMASLVHEQAKN